tara:strand:- start:20 stop:631 length:612 start_codon:yes stop_codon:yes gene_type:complete
MSEKTHFRTCPKCSNTLGHTSARNRDRAVKSGNVCLSCARTGVKRKPWTPEHKANRAISKAVYDKRLTDSYVELYGVKAKIRQLPMRKWGKQIKERDDYQCQCCGKEKTGPNSMHAHHIIPRGYFQEYAIDLSNGITLCSSCHRSLHADLDRLTLAGTKLDAEGFREHYNTYMSNHSFLRPFIPSSVLDIELRSVSYLMQQTA